MAQKIPVGPWPDFETACAFGGNVLRAAAEANGDKVTEWGALRRSDGLWAVEGFCHAEEQAVAREGNYILVGVD